MNKKKLTVLFLLVTFFSGISAHAQFKIGPKLGVSISKLSWSGSNLLEKNFSSDNRAGFTAGIQAEYIAPVLGLGADISLMYDYQQTNVEEFGVSRKVKGSFFEIPLHLKYQLGLPAIGSIVSPYIFTGPSVAFQLSGEKSYSKSKEAQWGWDIGLGLTVVKHLQIGAGYTFGINKIVNKIPALDQFNVPTDDIKVKNNYWTVTAAWMF